MIKTFKYINENKKKIKLGINSFEENNVKIVSPNEVATFELDISDNHVILIKTWKSKDQVLVGLQDKEAWTPIGKEF